MSHDESVELTIKFPNQQALLDFARWLCGSGEQGYWDWQEVVEKPRVTFHYHGIEDETKSLSDPTRYQEFMCDNIIRTTLVK